MSITHIESAEQFAQITSTSSLSIVDFHATWCGPCHAIAPTFEQLSREYPTIKFLKVDVDAVPDVSGAFRVSAMPTFLVLRGTNKVDEMKGANPAGLRALVVKHASSPAASSSSSSAPGATPGGAKDGLATLNSEIELPQVSCLNEDSAHTVRDMLRSGGSGGYLLSDSDEQLLLHLPMSSSIRLASIKLTTNSSASAQAPKKLKLFVNQPTLGFDDAESLDAAQELELTEAQAGGKEAVPLRFVRFQNVNVLSIFVSENQGGEEYTRIDKLELLGREKEGGKTDMTQLKAQGAE